MNPKVFISHASEDKMIFVEEFATRLRGLGVDAWLDKWEMKPGDSVVDRIFEEGIKEADAFIVVLSNNSVGKPWVKEEMNAGFVKRLNNNTKIIPVVIDDCEVPEALKSTLWEKISDLNSYKQSLDRIVAAIYEHDNKPPLGKPPEYVSAQAPEIKGLSKIDSLVLKLSCEYDLKHDAYILNPVKVFVEGDEWIIPESQLQESFSFLEEEGYLNIHHTMGPGLKSYRVTNYGFEEFAEANLDHYAGIQESVISELVNNDVSTNKELVERLSQPDRLIEHILDKLEMAGDVKLSKMSGRIIRVYNITSRLKRSLS